MSWQDALGARFSPEHQRAVALAKEEGRWVEGPHAPAAVLARIKELGGQRDHITSGWIMTDAGHVPEITALLQESQRAAEAEVTARRAAEEAEQRAADARRERTAQRLIAESGLTPTGEVVPLVEYSTNYMTRAEAVADAETLGSVTTLGDGRRGIIVAVDVWFTGAEEDFNPVTEYEAHWTWRYEVAVVQESANA